MFSSLARGTLKPRASGRGEKGRKFFLALRPRPPALPVPSPAGCPARSDADLVSLTSAGARRPRRQRAPGRAMGQGESGRGRCGRGPATFGRVLALDVRASRAGEEAEFGAGCVRTGPARSPRAGSGLGKRGRYAPQLRGESLHGVQFLRGGPPEAKHCGRGDRPAPSPLFLLRIGAAARRPSAADWLRAAAGAGTCGLRRCGRPRAGTGPQVEAPRGGGSAPGSPGSRRALGRLAPALTRRPLPPQQ